MANKIRVFVYDDNIGRQDALKMLLENTDDMILVGVNKNCDTIEEDIQAFQPQVILMDIDMPGTNGIDGLTRIKKSKLDVSVIMLTVFEDEDKIIACIQNGASGYFLKRTPPHKLLEGIREVLDGGAPMTPTVAAKVLKQFTKPIDKAEAYQNSLTQKECQVLDLLTTGHSYKMISDALDISYHTVNSHIKKIYEKLQVHSATEAIAKSKLLK